MDEFMAIQRALNHREAGTRPEFQEAVEIARGLLRVYEAVGNTPAEALACSYWTNKVDVLTAFIRCPDSAVEWDTVNLIAQKMLREERSLPPELAEWIADVLADQLLKQKEEKRRPRLTKRGVDPDKDSVRNMKIVNAVMMLTELGMIATRNITRGGTNAAEEGGWRRAPAGRTEPRPRHVMPRVGHDSGSAFRLARGVPSRGRGGALTYRNVVRIWTDGAPASPVLPRYTQIEK